MASIQVFLGTKAQYIKTAPLLRLMDDRGVDYRLIDSGQHAALSRGLRDELGVRPPDLSLGGSRNVDTITDAIGWALGVSRLLFMPARLRDEVFAGEGGVCVVHGDTPTTLLAALLARRAGLDVAHLEAGLRSHDLLHPFPEELIRLAVMRLSTVLYAPDDEAMRNLAEMGLSDRAIRIAGNTVVEALDHSLGRGPAVTGPAIVTTHRVENLTNTGRLRAIVSITRRIAAARDVRFVMHGPTREALDRAGLLDQLDVEGLEVSELLPHAAFVDALSSAPFVITDGGSIQEECALLGVPTLLWRERSERSDGIGANVVVAHYDDAVVTAFLDDPSMHRRPPLDRTARPSEQVLEDVLRRVNSGGPGHGAQRRRIPLRQQSKC